MSRYPAAGKCFIKHYIPGSLKLFSNLHGKTHRIHFGFVVEKIIEFGHTKISMFRPLEKFRILTSVSTLGEFLQIEVRTL